MAQPVKKRLLTIDEYHQMGKAGIFRPDDKVELIQGELIEMSPIESKHSSTVNRITHLFVPAFLNKAIVQVQGPVQIPEYSEPEPNITVLKSKSNLYAEQHPRPEDVFLLVKKRR